MITDTVPETDIKLGVWVWRKVSREVEALQVSHPSLLASAEVLEQSVIIR